MQLSVGIFSLYLEFWSTLESSNKKINYNFLELSVVIKVHLFYTGSDLNWKRSECFFVKFITITRNDHIFCQLFTINSRLLHKDVLILTIIDQIYKSGFSCLYLYFSKIWSELRKSWQTCYNLLRLASC